MNRNGGHRRTVHGEMARALYERGVAAPEVQPGRVKAMVVAQPAESSAEGIGPPSEGRATGVRFYRWARLEESATRVVEHHPRCYWI